MKTALFVAALFYFFGNSGPCFGVTAAVFESDQAKILKLIHPGDEVLKYIPNFLYEERPISERFEKIEVESMHFDSMAVETGVDIGKTAALPRELYVRIKGAWTNLRYLLGYPIEFIFEGYGLVSAIVFLDSSGHPLSPNEIFSGEMNQKQVTLSFVRTGSQINGSFFYDDDLDHPEVFYGNIDSKNQILLHKVSFGSDDSIFVGNLVNGSQISGEWKKGAEKLSVRVERVGNHFDKSGRYVAKELEGNSEGEFQLLLLGDCRYLYKGSCMESNARNWDPQGIGYENWDNVLMMKSGPGNSLCRSEFAFVGQDLVQVKNYQHDCDDREYRMFEGSYHRAN